VREELADFVKTVEEVPELYALLRNPQLDPNAKESILEELIGDADEIFRNFLRLLTEKGRATEIREIGREFERLCAEEEGVLNVELTTAVELSDEEAKTIVRQIEEASGQTVEARRTVDSDLVGGIVLQVGSVRLDASVRGRLERLREQLVTRS
jgi:F-type H+-transporting ATPase subunit delta